MKMNLTGAIEILKLHKHTTDKFKHSVGDQYVSDAIDTVVAEVEKHLITSGWIDVSVQMPEEKQKVLAYNGYRVVHTSWKDFTDQNAHWFRSKFDYWMPMIELPKTKNKNE